MKLQYEPREREGIVALQFQVCFYFLFLPKEEFEFFELL